MDKFNYQSFSLIEWLKHMVYCTVFLLCIIMSILYFHFNQTLMGCTILLSMFLISIKSYEKIILTSKEIIYKKTFALGLFSQKKSFEINEIQKAWTQGTYGYYEAINEIIFLGLLRKATQLNENTLFLEHKNEIIKRIDTRVHKNELDQILKRINMLLKS